MIRMIRSMAAGIAAGRRSDRQGRRLAGRSAGAVSCGSRQCAAARDLTGGCGVVKVVSAKASSQVPAVLALEYSVARFSKKLVCSTAFSISSSQGSGFFSMW